MTGSERRDLVCRLASLGVFRGILHYETVEALLSLMSTEDDPIARARYYGAFVYSLREDGYSFSDFLCRAVYADENRYIVDAAAGRPIPSVLCANAERELSLFTRLTTLTRGDLLGEETEESLYPDFSNTPTDFSACYGERIRNVDKYGYGIFATGRMFHIEDGEIRAVSSADDIRLDSFVGYEEERRQVFENTRALCEGKPAANVLLCGDAGTGKSSTVKACANHFYDAGVRLIEMRKDQLFSLAGVMGRIANHPLKFIIFIDDLSFNKNDDLFSMLKAVLEGSASSKAGNAVIYATSNRRHIVKESFSDREHSDDVHHSDTVQELMSLSDRFGLTVYFGKPDKSLYLSIVHALAERYGVEMDPREMDVQAEAFALGRGSRSPRAAEQFINSLLK